VNVTGRSTNPIRNHTEIPAIEIELAGTVVWWKDKEFAVGE
jgi:hypothetical protein